MAILFYLRKNCYQRQRTPNGNYQRRANVKEKQHSIPLLCYIILVIKRLTISRSSRSSIRKNIPYKILTIGNCSAEIFGCSIEVLIPWEIMTSSEMIFRFQEIIGILI